MRSVNRNQKPAAVKLKEQHIIYITPDSEGDFTSISFRSRTTRNPGDFSVDTGAERQKYLRGPSTLQCFNFNADFSAPRQLKLTGRSVVIIFPSLGTARAAVEDKADNPSVWQ